MVQSCVGLYPTLIQRSDLSFMRLPALDQITDEPLFPIVLNNLRFPRSYVSFREGGGKHAVDVPLYCVPISERIDTV